MANPASELHDILVRWQTAQGSTNAIRRGFNGNTTAAPHREHVRAMVLLEAIDSEIDRLAEAGRRVSKFRNAFPSWVEGVLALRSGVWKSSNPSTADLPSSVLDTLEVLADILDHEASTPLDPNATEILGALLNEMLQAAESDTGLDPRLSVYIRRAVRHLQTCLEEYETVGQSATMDAYEAVWVATQAAAAQSSDPTKWQKMRDRFFFPTAAGLIANAPGLAIQISQITS